jgi:DNA-directed RNA polymerase sigma subunit (sigma70/sigma32)
MLREALNNPTVLTEKEKLIINLRYGLHDSTPKTLLQIADILKSNGHKATKVWVFTIEKKANRKLYNYFKKRKVLDLFE